MLLRPRPLPLGLENCAVEIVEITALEESVVRRAPTGYIETYPVTDSGRGKTEDSDNPVHVAGRPLGAPRNL